MIDPFLIPDHHGVLNYGVRLNFTPWTNQNLKKEAGFDEAELKRRLLEDANVPESLVELLFMAGKLNVHVLIFDPYIYQHCEELPIYDVNSESKPF